MALSFEFASENNKRFQGTTGLTLCQFRNLVSGFDEALFSLLQKKTINGKPRRNKPGFRCSAFLTPELRLFFVLYVLKTNALQQSIATVFEIDQSTVSKYFKLFFQALVMALKDYMPSLVAEDLANDPDLLGGLLLIDGTERPVERDTYEQEEFYSGKKKRHTIKNLLIVTLTGLIVWLSPTYGGCTHDKKMADESDLPETLKLLADLGFQGLQKQIEDLLMPFKKEKGKSLSDSKKLCNKILSSIRVKVENVIGSVKSFRMVKDTCRLRSMEMKDMIFQAACALHNFKTKQHT